MNYLLIIISIPITVLIFYYLIKKPLRLLGCYIVAVPILPPILIGSIEISTLDLLTLPTILHLIYNISQNGYKIKGRIAIGFFLYTAAAVISFISFTIQQTSLSLPIMFRIIRLVEMLLPVILASQLSSKMKKNFPIILFLLASAVTSVIAVIMFVNGISLRNSQTFATAGELIYRAAGTHGSSGSFGMLMGFSSLVAIWVLIFFKDLKFVIQKRYILIITITSVILTILGLIVALSRGGFIILTIGVIVLLIPLLKRPKWLFKVLISTLTIILLGIPIVKIATEDSLVSIGFEEFINKITSLTDITDDTENITGHRSVYWQMAWDYFKTTPISWPFGLGYKSLRLHYKIPPDNNFNQALFEMGAFGVFSLLALLYFIFISGIKTLKENKAFGIIILAIWLGLISNMISADVLTYWHNIPALFILLVILSHRDNNHSKIL